MASSAYPSLQTPQVTAGQLTPVVPAGQLAGGLHVHVGQPSGSGTLPFEQAEAAQVSAGHFVLHEGGCHAHLPSVPRVQAAGMIVPVGQYGCAYGGGPPHSVGVHAGGGLHWHVGHPLASTTLPY